MKKQLPIGASTLSMIIPDCVYIDKTPFVSQLANTGRYYFLSRPRRFGKSLFIDTLKQAFQGNQKLFKGLYLEKNWDWSKSYPVIHFDFGVSGAYNSEEKLHDVIWDVLHFYENEYAISLTNKDFGLAFHELIRKVFEKTKKQLVILIDEYEIFV